MPDNLELYELITKTLATGKCPVCAADITSDEAMKEYFCSQDKSHFDLVIQFINEGEGIHASLNGQAIPQNVLAKIDW